MEDGFVTCACGEHNHPISEVPACRKCQDIIKAMRASKIYQELVLKSKRKSS